MNKDRLIEIGLGLGVALVWGMGLVFAKSVLDHFPPILLMAFRFLVTAVVLARFAKPTGGQVKQLVLISIIGSTVQYGLTFSGLKGLDAGTTSLIIQLEIPFLVLIGAVFLGERPSLRKWVGIAIAFFGVYQIAGEPKVAEAWTSVLLIICGGVAWASGQAMVRQLKDISGLNVAAWVALLACPQLFVLSALVETGQVQAVITADFQVWAVVAYLGLVMTALGYFMWYTLIRRVPVSQAGPYLLTLPVFAILGGWLFLGESLTNQTMFGGSIILVGVGLIVFERSPSRPA